MLDLKFFDIPETVRRATAQLRGRGIYCTTVHGDPAMLRAAVAGAQSAPPKTAATPNTNPAPADTPRILAVTALTSWGDETAANITALVRSRAAAALQAGCAGIIASAQEAAQLRADLGWDFLLLTPGIRPSPAQGAESPPITKDDQVRTTNPSQAIRAGVDHLIIGRPIRDSHHPEQTIDTLQEEIRTALSTPAPS